MLSSGDDATLPSDSDLDIVRDADRINTNPPSFSPPCFLFAGPAAPSAALSVCTQLAHTVIDILLNFDFTNRAWSTSVVKTSLSMSGNASGVTSAKEICPRFPLSNFSRQSRSVLPPPIFGTLSIKYPVSSLGSHCRALTCKTSPLSTPYGNQRGPRADTGAFSTDPRVFRIGPPSFW